MESLCLQALAHHSKDLQIAAWLTEAWVHLKGLGGLQDGVSLLQALCDAYWPSLHPLPRDGDIEFRLAPFEWMDEKILVLLRIYPVTAPASDRLKSYSLLDWTAATQMVGLGKAALQQALNRIEREGGVTLDQFNDSREGTPAAYYQNLYQQSQQILHQMQRFNDSLQVKLPQELGFFYHLRTEMQKMIDFAKITLEARHIPLEENPSLEEKVESTETPAQKKVKKGSDMPASVTPLSSPSTVSNSFSSRQDAYAMLEQVAAYLSTVEPHSPTPLLIRRAIAWGKMSLSEVLQELLQDKNDLVKIQNLLGIEK